MSRVVNWFDVKNIRINYTQIPIAATAGLKAAKNNTRPKMLSNIQNNHNGIKNNVALSSKTQNRTLYQTSLPFDNTERSMTEMTSRMNNKTAHINYDQLVDIHLNIKRAGSSFSYYFKKQYEVWHTEDPKALLDRLLRPLPLDKAKSLTIKPSDYEKISPQTMMKLVAMRWTLVPKEEKIVGFSRVAHLILILCSQKYDSLRQKIGAYRKSLPRFMKTKELKIGTGPKQFKTLVKDCQL
ncbi:hypothetical protein E3Q18_02124 [Wallemia mellicola]|uniref:Uncharacterized protein n=1 Tax=Wallemia mellicola TaxID=1708541 RepID=A0A4V4MQ11_9BASI|nr:hypothetical protein E3Q23_02022 [Wallemia mellicola]TIB98281.1 hypothetical protein E3Q18_02124 [Wallemia mellicola]TIC12853.1 hypothetical protein E3Q15_02164 [Wallemia mellicola]TIC27849.1 hypothetical protein E3Q11_02112 [Wallemia mellicola]TIC30492.1 hypothetical protein E3Q10_02062 [Wallemia mellicola]